MRTEAAGRDIAPKCPASVSEIHRYPLKPEGVEEPLWMTPEWRRSVLDHFCESSWLRRASELPRRIGSTEAAHAAFEPVYILCQKRGLFIVRCESSGRSSRSWRKRLIVEVVDLWREVREWWRKDAVDRLVVRVLLYGGAVVDLARYNAEEWVLVGIVD